MTTTAQCGSAHTYTTITAAHAAYVTGGFIISCYNDSEFTDSTLSLGGSSSTNYERLTVATGQSIFDNTANPMVYDATKGVGWVFNPAFDSVLNVSDNFYLDRFQIRNNRGTNSHGCIGAGAFPGLIEISGNLFQDETAVDGDQACVNFNGGGKLVNNVIIAWSQHAVVVKNGTGAIVNNTIVAPSDKSNTLSLFFTNGSGTSKITNNAGFGFNSWGVTGSNSTGSNNASDLATITGTSAVTSLTYANQFNAVATTGPADFRPKSGNGLVAGVTDTTDIASGLDAFSVTRAATWTIGAIEYVVAGGSFKPSWAVSATRMISGGLAA